MKVRDIAVRVIRSGRKTLAVEITKDAEVLVRAPYRVSEGEITRFLDQNRKWITDHLQLREQKNREKEQYLQEVQPFSGEQLQRLTEQAKQIIPARLRYYAEQMGVTYARVTIRHQKTRWGSCSAKGNLNFNCLLMLTPIEVVDYVVVHELAHRKEMNHSARFWKEVETIMPDYRAQRRWLKENGDKLIARLPE